MIFQGVKALEDPVVEEFLAQFIPDVFNRVELRGIGRKFQQVDVGRGLECLTAMPACTVNHHDDMLVGVTCRDLVEEQLHAFGVDVRQDQAVEVASAHVHRAIGIGVFVRQHGLADGAHRLGSPAPAHVRDASEARLVLVHQLDGLALRPVLADGGERFGEFFFHSS